ncbi:MAG: radical SAM family heme chaperone HemW [bacterium]
MSGIYIHIPFCRKACHYCNFHFSTSLTSVDGMIEAIDKEIRMRATPSMQQVNTIYFGGGTPSIIDPEKISELIATIRSRFTVDPEAEITLEANPDDINMKNALAWKAMGINRFSIGIQSFSEENLQWMNRAHNAQQSIDCINIIRTAGFNNFSIDLIYGTPMQDQRSWEDDLKLAIELKVPHLSCYALTVEEGTALHEMIKKKKRTDVSPDEQAERFNSLVTMTRQSGYLHYEISNFALPGMESKHNSAYWQGKPYMGFGPAAHSFQGNTRSWNVSNNMKYIRSIQESILPSEHEELSSIELLNEYIMTGLRSSSGIHRLRIIDQWGMDCLNKIENEMKPWLYSGKLLETESGWVLSESGKFFADGIAASLFLLKH